MTTEIWWLAAISLATVVMWVPSTLDLIRVQGLMTGLGNRDNVGELSPWAARAKRAHENAVHNLVVFTAVVLAAHAAGTTGAATTTAAMIYFWARIVHYLSYLFGVIGLRTLAFVAGWMATIRIGWSILSG